MFLRMPLLPFGDQRKFCFQQKEPEEGCQSSHILSPRCNMLTLYSFWVLLNSHILWVYWSSALPGSILDAACKWSIKGAVDRNILHGCFAHMHAFLSAWSPLPKSHSNINLLSISYSDSRALISLQGPSARGPRVTALVLCPWSWPFLYQGKPQDSWKPLACAVYEGTQFTATWTLPVVYPCEIVSLKLMECTDFKLSWINIILEIVGSLRGVPAPWGVPLRWAFGTSVPKLEPGTHH